MYSPGYEEENKTKPKITLKIEESDGGLQPEQAAAALLQGINVTQLILVHHTYISSFTRRPEWEFSHIRRLAW